ncbi:hypothetical protein ACLFMI_23215 [Pseudonocardia nantongensis]|uniref:YVTN family beta-propeller repeat protein n=1 Tax=Pseudonocardia nantongensis TaxID=1181885 RepID=UPI00397E0934
MGSGGLEHFDAVRLVDAAGPAELWHAVDEQDEHVALTILEPGSAADADRAGWVSTAAWQGSTLGGAHLVPIRDHGVDGDRLYTCREWIDGTVLADLPLDALHADVAVKIVDQVALALDTAWSGSGLVHGDLRAEHVLVVADGGGWRVVLVGFEWARLAGLGPQPGAAGAHLAPERFAGAPAARRGDVYSLAFLLYLLLAGNRPFDDGGPAPGGRSVRSVGGPGRAPWDRLLGRALAADTGRRPGTAGEFADEARSALREWRREVAGPGVSPLSARSGDGGPAGAPADGGPEHGATGGRETGGPSGRTGDEGPATPSPGPRTDRAGSAAGDGSRWRADDSGPGRAPSDGVPGRGRLRVPGARTGPGPDAHRAGRWRRIASRPGARRWLFAALGVGVVVAAGTGIALGLTARAPGAAGPTVELGGEPVAVASSPDPGTVLVSDATGSVGIVDLAGRTVVARVPVGDRPRGIAVERSGRYAYVTNSGSDTVSVIDIPGRTLAATITVGETPVAVTVRADGARAYVANEQSASITVIDTAARSVVGTIPVGFLPWKTLEGIAVSRDGTRAVVTLDSGIGADTVQIVDLGREEVTGAVTVGRSPGGVAISPDGRRAWVADSDDGSVSVVDLVAGARTRAIAVGGTPTSVLLGRGERAYVPAAADGAVAALDTTAGTRVADPAPGLGTTTMSIAAGGRALHLVGADGVLTTVSLG